MPKYLTEEPTPVSRRMITMEVFKTPGNVLSPLSVEVCLMNADHYAREFSMLVKATGGRVRLLEDARIRAVYEDGQRIQENDMRDFYEMSDEAHAESRILCSVKHEYF